MFRCEPVRTNAGHRKAAPFLAVSATSPVPDTLPDTGNAALARVSLKVSGCPAETHRPSRMHTHARPPARTHEHTPTSNGHPDTSSIGADLRCPVPKVKADTSGHLDSEPDTMSKPMRQAMPTAAAWVDDLRAAFGAEVVDRAIRGAVRDGRPTFYASEAGHQLGTPATLPAEARLHMFSDQEIDEMESRISERARRAER